MNGLSESMTDALPSRNTPPSLTDPAAVLPHPAADTATAAATAGCDSPPASGFYDPMVQGALYATDSPSDLAGQMREVIRTKLAAGESGDQIIAFFVERYGDSVLIEPPRHGIGLVVWAAPLLILVVGGLLLWRLLRGWVQPHWSPAASAPAPTAPYRNGTAASSDPAPQTSVERARAELERFRREG